MRRALAPLLALTLLLSPGAEAMPTDPETASGSVTVQTSGSRMDITQQTQQAILNWRSFNIGAGELVRILQPGPTSTLLSRVTGQDPSLILGSLTATGRLFLLNPNGVFIGSGARIETAGLLVSTLGMSDADFLNGNYRLVQDLSLPQAAVVNQGEIRVADGGFVVLAAPLVSNEGLILARTGQVGLAAGTEVTVSFDAQGLMNFVLEGSTQEPGTVLVPRDQVSELLGQLVESPNLVEAGAIVEEGGQVRLTGSGGVLLQSGTIQAEAGRVRLDSSQTTVMAGQISADGLGPGSVGGDIRVLSQGTTVLSPAGHLSARGGEAGQGGFIEVSGRDFYLQGSTDVSAPGGVPGELLIDPPVINIVNGGGGTLDPGLPSILLADPSIPPNTLSELALEGVTSGTIRLQGGQITVFDIADNEVSLQPGVSLNIDGFNFINSSILFLDGNDRFTTSNGGGFDWVVQGPALIGSLLAPGGTIRVLSNGLALDAANGGVVADTVLLNSGLFSLQTTPATPAGTVAVTAETLTVVGRDAIGPGFLTVDAAHLQVFTELGVLIDNVRVPVAGNSSLSLTHTSGNAGIQELVMWGPDPASSLGFGLSGPDELGANLPGTNLTVISPRDILVTGVTANSVVLTSSTGQILDANPNPGADITATTLLQLSSPVGIGSAANPLELSGDTVSLNTENGTLAPTRATLLTTPSLLQVRTSGPVSVDGMAQMDFSSGNVLNASVPGSLAFKAPQIGLGVVASSGDVSIESAGAILDLNGASTNVTATSVNLTSTLSGASVTADVVANELNVLASASTISLNQGQGAVDRLIVDNLNGSTTIGHDGSIRPHLTASVLSDSIAMSVANGSLTASLVLADGPVSLSAGGDVEVGLINQSAAAPISISAGGNILDGNAVGDADNSGHLETGEVNVSGSLQNMLTLNAGGRASLDVVGLGQLALDSADAAINFERAPFPFGLRLEGQTTGTLDLTAVDPASMDTALLGQFTGQTVNITSPGILDDPSSSGRLSAQSASLTAGTFGNGLSTAPLQLDVRNLELQSDSAVTAIHNLGDLNLISAVSTDAQPLGGIEITTTGDLILGLVESSAGVDRLVGLFVGGSVVDGNGAASNIRSPSALIDAGGSIGDPSDPVELDGGRVVAASQTDSVYLHAEGPSTEIFSFAGGTGEVVLTSGQDILLGTTASPTNVTVVAGGNIIDANDGATVRDNILAQNANLTAGGIIGEATNPLEVQLNGAPGVLTATAGGSRDGVSVSVNLASGGQLVLGNTPPGAVILNGSDILDPLPPAAANLLLLDEPGAFDSQFRSSLLSASILAQDDPKLANTSEGMLYTYDVVFVVNAQSWLDVIRGSVVWEDSE